MIEPTKKLNLDCCVWTFDADGFYRTDCGQTFQFDHGTPTQNHARFCQACGRKLRTGRPKGSRR